jgi:O-antigen ligase
MHSVRASYVALLAMTPVIFLAEFRKKAALSMLGLLLCAAALAGGLCMLRPELARTAMGKVLSVADLSNRSNMGRVVYWKKAVEVFSENPVNGIGYRRFNRRHVDIQNRDFEWSFAHAHNELLSMLAETGLIGVLAWLGFKIKLLTVFFKHRRHWIGAMMLYLLVAFEIHNCFECYLYERSAYIFVYVLLGLGLNQLVRKRRGIAPLKGIEPAA